MAYDDFEETQTDFDLSDPDDRRTYDTRYIQKLKELTGGIDGDSQDEIIDELQNISYNPSNSPENDCELNVLKSKNVIRQKSRMDSHTKSFLEYIASEDGRSLADVKREYRKQTRGGQ